MVRRDSLSTGGKAGPGTNQLEAIINDTTINLGFSQSHLGYES
jgi:hypothetical protein